MACGIERERRGVEKIGMRKVWKYLLLLFFIHMQIHMWFSLSLVNKNTNSVYITAQLTLKSKEGFQSNFLRALEASP